MRNARFFITHLFELSRCNDARQKAIRTLRQVQYPHYGEPSICDVNRPIVEGGYRFRISSLLYNLDDEHEVGKQCGQTVKKVSAAANWPVRKR